MFIEFNQRKVIIKNHINKDKNELLFIYGYSLGVLKEKEYLRNSLNDKVKLYQLIKGKKHESCALKLKYNRNMKSSELLKRYNDFLRMPQCNLNDNEISLFGKMFVKANNKKCKIISDNKMNNLVEKIQANNPIVKIKLKLITELTSLSMMFFGCYSLISIENISILNSKYINDLLFMFSFCSSLIYIPDISNFKINNCNSLRGMFMGCSSLKSIPDISKWDTRNIRCLDELFFVVFLCLLYQIYLNGLPKM
jgi:surface protein